MLITCCKTKTNTMQIKVVKMKYILLCYIMGKKKSKKRVEKVEKMKNRENERKRISFLRMGSPFIGFLNGFH